MSASRRVAAASHAKLRFAGALVRPLVQKAERTGFACYHIRIAPGGVVPPAFHKKAVELIWILRGSGTITLGRRAVRMLRGDSLLIRPPTPHAFLAGRSGMEFVAVLRPWVDSSTDFHAAHAGTHAAPRVLGGRWRE